MGCNCGKSKTAAAFDVKVPGQEPRVVSSESAAKRLTTGKRGASYTAISAATLGARRTSEQTFTEVSP